MDIQLSPYEVFPFDQERIVERIRHITGGGSRSDIAQKDQLKYIFRYLSDAEVGALTVVVETAYIDRNYLEDYSEYYARCFHEYPRRCCRLHFFACKFSEQEFVEAIVQREHPLKAKLQPDYCGYVVVRPIPATFLGKICLRPYSRLAKSKHAKVVTRKNAVWLFGIPLYVDSTPLLEQDKAVAACATSALWTFLCATNHLTENYLPSPSAITNSATPAGSEGARTFPTRGLTPEQISRSLKSYGLEPTILSREEDLGDTFERKVASIKEHVYAYLSHYEKPVLLGGNIYRIVDGRPLSLGKHLICVLGYECDESDPPKDKNTNLVSHRIQKLYVHDDRIGPYVRLRLKKKEIKSSNPKRTGVPAGLTLSMEGLSDDSNGDHFVPDLLIFAPYHKVRIGYDTAFAICDVLRVIAGLYAHKKRETSQIAKELTDGVEAVASGIWDIGLVDISKIKSHEYCGENWSSFNGDTSKRSIFVASLPKYLWRCRLMTANGPFLDVLLDATGLAQGDIVVGCVAFAAEATLFWQFLGEGITPTAWSGLYANFKSATAKMAAASLVRHFGLVQKQSSTSVLFGSPKLPKRIYKPGELDLYSNITPRFDLIYLLPNLGKSIHDLELREANTYIWVVNGDGNLVLGPDVHSKDGNHQGHPTLIDGGFARCAGELKFLRKKGIWGINAKSRAYPMEGTKADVKKRLEYVKATFLAADKLEILEL